MIALYDPLAWLPKYAKAFGFFKGLRLLWRLERPRPNRSTPVRAYRVPGYAGPVYMRDSDSDRSAFRQCLVRRQYHLGRFPQYKRLMSAYRASVRAGMAPLIIDGGGNIGMAALYFANLFPEAMVYAIEPDDANVQILRRNIAALGDRVRALKGGIWNESKNLKIINPGSTSLAYRVGRADDRQDAAVKGYTVDEICRLAGSRSPFIVKLDIEGAQQNLFKTNTGWVSDTHLIILELDDWLLPWQGTSRAFFSCICQYPFDYLIHGENIFCFRDFRSPVSPPS
jgi:FkbM family methyltransferase